MSERSLCLHERLDADGVCQCGWSAVTRESGDGEPSSAPPAAKPRIFLDMDGVVVDFESYKNSVGMSGDEVKKLPGAYLNMRAYPEALKAIKWFVGAGYDVWLATKPPTGIAFAYADKAEWVFRNLPELRRKLIITHDKGLLGDTCDFLVDDRPHKANCERFKGTLIRFIDGETWDGVIAKIRRSGAAQEVSPPSPERVSIEVFQHDWVPGFAAFHDDGQINETAKAHVIINIGSLLAAVQEGDLAAKDLPYMIAESLMHEVIHVLEAWAKVEFSEDRVEELLTKYREKYSRETKWEYTGAEPGGGDTR